MPDPSAFPTAQAPRTQGFLQSPDPGDEEALFIQGFSELAYKAISKGQPALLASVVTFRVLEKDVQNGEAVGTFIIKQGNEVLFVPVVLVDNAVKPLDLFYCRSHDRYYPLTPEWLREVQTMSVNQMGSAVTVPKTLTTDVDIRNLMVPPSVGRYSYASDQSDPGWTPFARIHRELPGYGRQVFPEALAHLGEQTKLAVRMALQLRPKVAQALAEQYGVQKIAQALRPAPKVAAEDRREIPRKHDVFLATASTPLQEFHRELEPGEVADAYGTAKSRGFFVKDRRGSHKELVSMPEDSLRLTAPDMAGLYRVYMTDGQSRVALVIPSPDSVHRDRGDEHAMRYGRNSHSQQNRDHADHRRYLVLFPDGKYALISQLVAQQVAADYDELLDFVESRVQTTPKESGVGCLLTLTRLTIRATSPEYADHIQSSGGPSSFNLGACHAVTKVPGILGGPLKPPKQDAMLIGEDTVWWPCSRGSWVEGDFLSSPAQIWAMIERGLTKSGAVKVQVKVAAEGTYLVGPDRVEVRGPQAVVKIATHYGLSVPAAAMTLQAAASRAPVRMWVKQADGPPPGGDPSMQGGDPSMQQGMDPSMQQGAPPPPPPPGLDLVLAEKRQLIQQQMAALQQQTALLDEIQARAMGVDQGGAMSAPQGMMAMMGAPPPSMMGGPAMAPVGGPQPPPQQGMAPQPGMPPQGAPQPGMPPQGAPQPGMPPQPGMQPPPGAFPGPSAAAMPGAAPMQPGAPQAPPMSIMEQAPTPDTIAQQINPAFLNDAALMNDPQVFDAAAVASFAKPKALREILQNYAPSLDQAVDKLGRTLLLLYTQTRDVREKIGDDAHRDLEQRVRDVFRAMGDALLTLKEHGDQMTPTGLRPT